jgi:hypothetical protein
VAAPLTPRPRGTNTKPCPSSLNVFEEVPGGVHIRTNARRAKPDGSVLKLARKADLSVHLR